MVAAGASNREVAQKLGLAEDTVKHHISNVFDKLGVSNRAEMASTRRATADDSTIAGRHGSVAARQRGTTPSTEVVVALH